MLHRVAILLAILGGYVDTLSYLSLQGLFAAHVTGNFVTLGAALVLGSSGVTAKLAALPVFCLVVAAVRLLDIRLKQAALQPLPVLFSVMLVLLIIAAGLAFMFSPFLTGDGWQALLTGMVLVSAMAILNGAQRLHLPQIPPSTLMTGSTTQAMLDAADLGGSTGGERDAARARIQRLGASILSFAAGCGAAALLVHFTGWAAFTVPPILTAVVLALKPHKA